MRLSRGRVALRIALLALGGAWMVWRGATARGAARALDGGEALLGSRLALVWILVGALALATAASAAASLRRRPPKRTLHLGDLARHDADPARERSTRKRPFTRLEARDRGGPRSRQ